MNSVEIDEARAGRTLASVVREMLGEIPWSRARELCRTGRVTLDETVCTDDARRLRVGETVQVAPTGRKLRSGVLPDEAIVHLDRDVVVVRKPAGLLTVPYAEGDKDTLVDQAFAAVRRMSMAKSPGNPAGPPQKTSLGVVHRLDKDTTGLLVFARNLHAKRELAQQFREHDVGRRYLAIVHGLAATEKHDTVLVPDRGDGLRGSYGVFRAPKGPPPREARRAITHVHLLERLQGASLVECHLETGRQHQIRIHLSEAGHPLVGEPVYIRDFRGERISAPRPMLHATSLAFDHPRSGERLSFDDPPPADFDEVLRRLRAPAPSRKR